MRWSLPAVVAAALHDGAITLDTFEGDLSDGARELARRIVWQPLEPNDFPNRFEAELSARRRDGSTLDIRLDDVYGNASRPAATDDVLQKFRANAGRALDEPAVRALEDALMTIDGGGFARLKPLLATNALTRWSEAMQTVRSHHPQRQRDPAGAGRACGRHRDP